MATHFRKQVVVEAVQWHEDTESFEELQSWHPRLNFHRHGEYPHGEKLSVYTSIDGIIEVKAGDWVVRREGSVEVVGDAVFRRQYRQAEEEGKGGDYWLGALVDKILSASSGRQNIRVHGNGYIQLDLGPLRLHVWADGIPRQKVPTLIHNHTYSYQSTIVGGVLQHQVYRLDTAGTAYRLYKAESTKGQDTRLLWTKEEVGARPIDTFSFPAGSSYDFAAGEFHTATPLWLPTITLMQKTKEGVAHGPIVLCPRDQEPDNTFDRYQMDEVELWGIVVKALADVAGGEYDRTGAYLEAHWIRENDGVHST